MSLYGSPDPDLTSTTTNPQRPDRISAWHLTETKDPFGNLIRYTYETDSGEADGHRWAMPLIKQIAYADYGDDPDNPNFFGDGDLCV